MKPQAGLVGLILNLILGPPLLLADLHVQARMSGTDAEAIAWAELQRLGHDVTSLRVDWDERNTAWRASVGEHVSSQIEMQYTTCGYWAVRFTAPSQSGRPSAADSSGSIFLSLGGGLFVLVETCTGSVIGTVPAK